MYMKCAGRWSCILAYVLSLSILHSFIRDLHRTFTKFCFRLSWRLSIFYTDLVKKKLDKAWFQIINFLYIFLYTDIDECKQSGICPLSARCVNTYGSYRCIPSTSCPQGHEIDPVTQTCVGKSAIPLLPAELMNIEHLQSGV